MKSSPVIFFLVILTCLFLETANAQYLDFTKRIQIGPKYHTVGFNLNLADYPAGTAFSVTNPNDPTHVYETLKAAISQIGTNGGTVHFKQGLYVSARNLEITNSKVHLKGEGMYNTIIKLADNAVPFIFGTSTKSGFIRTRATNNFIISNMTLDGNKVNQEIDEDHEYGRYGFFTEGCTDVWVDNVRVINWQGYGFDPHGWKSAGIYGQYLTITNCIAENNDWDGFTLDQTLNMMIYNNLALNNGRHGFNVVTGTKFANLTNNNSTGNGFFYPKGGSGCGIMVQNNQEFSTSDIVIINNFVANSKKAGVCLNDVPNVLIRNNNIINSCYCFDITDGLSTSINNNVCTVKTLVKLTDTSVVYGPENACGSGVFIYDNVLNKLNSCLN